MTTKELVFTIMERRFGIPEASSTSDIFSTFNLDRIEILDMVMEIEDRANVNLSHIDFLPEHSIQFLIDAIDGLVKPKIDSSNSNVIRLSNWCRDNAEIFTIAAENCDDPETRAKFKLRELMHKEVADVLLALIENKS